MCNNVYDLTIECVISNDNTYISYVFPETDTEQIQKQTYCKPTLLTITKMCKCTYLPYKGVLAEINASSLQSKKWEIGNAGKSCNNFLSL